jgi:hypothetical protein
VNDKCPSGFFKNEGDRCVPNTSCPSGYYRADDDESGRCIKDTSITTQPFVTTIPSSTGNRQPNVDSTPSSLTTTQPSLTFSKGGPDRDCLYNPDLPKCAAVNDKCPSGFFKNEGDRCVPNTSCPSGYYRADDDESGRCIKDTKGCPKGMTFSSETKNCIKRIQQSKEICNNNRDDDRDGKKDEGCITSSKIITKTITNNPIIIVTVPQGSCPDISKTLELESEIIKPNGIRILASFDDCVIKSGQLLLNMKPDNDLKLLVGNFGTSSDAVVLGLTQTQAINQNLIYSATITADQQGLDLETGKIDTVNDINGIVLWNDSDEPVEFKNNDSVKMDIKFE